MTGCDIDSLENNLIFPISQTPTQHIFNSIRWLAINFECYVPNEDNWLHLNLKKLFSYELTILLLKVKLQLKPFKEHFTFYRTKY